MGLRDHILLSVDTRLGIPAALVLCCSRFRIKKGECASGSSCSFAENTQGVSGVPGFTLDDKHTSLLHFAFSCPF